MQAPLPLDESQRLAALHDYQILDTPPEAAFNRIADLASQVLDAPIAAVSFVDRDRQWLKAKVGPLLTDTPREHSFCAHAILEDDLFIVPDATEDERFMDNPIVTGEMGVRFYAGAVLRTPEGQPLGALCVIDTHPRQLDDHQRKILRDLASLTVDELALSAQHKNLRKLHATIEKHIEERTAELTRVNRALQAEIRQRNLAENALRHAKEEAEQANRAKSEFLSRMSHELRTPLNAILGYGQLLELNARDGQDALRVKYILKGGHHLLSLIDEVLDLSRAETGALRLTPSKVDADQLLQECVGLVAALAETRGIVCQLQTPTPCQTSLWVDVQRLRQMLLNLLSNAIKYNREGGHVVVDAEKTPSERRLRLKVTDTGPGISPEGLARLFVPFERLGQEYGAVKGTGLGLVISQRIAEAMGGSLGVDSEVGKGSTFWIDLPLAEESQTVPVPALPSPLDHSPTPKLGTPTEAAKVLYIEDSDSNVQIVRMLITSQRPHWQFSFADEGRQGLEQARQTTPDLILLDLQLPGMSGDEVLAELRRDSRTRQIPVILLSADATAHSRKQLLAKGADDYISKPFKVVNLLETLDRTLLKSTAARAHQ